MELLSDEEFKREMGEQMTPVHDATPLPPEFWDYVETISRNDYEGFDCPNAQIVHAWRNTMGRCDHLLLNSHDPNVFMVVLIDRTAGTVYGHHLLNLRAHYGLDDFPVE